MKDKRFKELITNTDIYLIDQILKGNYIHGQKVLDAGCGNGRNLPWFIENNFDIYAIDKNKEQISFLKELYPNIVTKFSLVELDKLPFETDFFDHVICSAVLHFANSEAHFKAMFIELVRVVKRGGSLFIRMTTDIGLDSELNHLGNGVYMLKDETKRFFITKKLLLEMMQIHNLKFLEPFKTTVVKDLRSMATLVLKKS